MYTPPTHIGLNSLPAILAKQLFSPTVSNAFWDSEKHLYAFPRLPLFYLTLIQSPINQSIRTQKANKRWVGRLSLLRMLYNDKDIVD